MIVSAIISSVTEKLKEIINALSNRLTAQDNWGPEGEVGQVLTSRGPRDVDPPPHFSSIADILRGISTQDGAVLAGIPGLTGAVGATGPQGPVGADGALFGNLDGGVPDSVYGGVFLVEGGVP